MKGLTQVSPNSAGASGAVELDEKDLRFEEFDHDVHGVPRGIKITHKPTGLWGACNKHSSNLKNKAVALDCLRELLATRCASCGGSRGRYLAHGIRDAQTWYDCEDCKGTGCAGAGDT